MLILCDRCIARVKKRGESILVGDMVFNAKNICDICDNPHHLFEVTFPEIEGVNPH